MAISIIDQESFGEIIDITYNPTGVNQEFRVIFDSSQQELQIFTGLVNNQRTRVHRQVYVFGPYSELPSGQQSILTGYINSILHMVTGEAP